LVSGGSAKTFICCGEFLTGCVGLRIVPMGIGRTSATDVTKEDTFRENVEREENTKLREEEVTLHLMNIEESKITNLRRRRSPSSSDSYEERR